MYLQNLYRHEVVAKEDRRHNTAYSWTSIHKGLFNVPAHNVRIDSGMQSHAKRSGNMQMQTECK